MERLNAWVTSVVPGVHGAYLRCPLFARLNNLPVGALWIGTDGARAGRARQAPSCDARVARTCGKKVRIRGREDVGHHAARRATSHKDAGLVGFVVVNGVTDHVSEARGVAAAFACEALGGCDVPTVEVPGRRWVDDDEGALLVGERDVFCLPGVGQAGAATAMEGEDDGWRGRESWRDRDVHRQTRWVGTEVYDLLESRAGWLEAGDDGKEDVDEMHFDLGLLIGKSVSSGNEECWRIK